MAPARAHLGTGQRALQDRPSPDSLWDVSTELSLDGGQSWTPVDTAQHLVLWGIGLPVELQSFSVE